MNTPPETVPFQIPTVSTAAPETRVASGMSVLTVTLQVPAGKPDAPPTGSTMKPSPSGVVGIEAICTAEDVPGSKAYQPVSL